MRTRIILVVLLSIAAAGLSFAGQKKKTESERMILVKKGFFTPFFKDENSRKKVEVNSFFLDTYPVTNKEYLEFVKANPQWRKSRVKKIFADKSYLAHWKSDLEPGSKVNMNSAVINVSWFAASAYAEWKGKRLPTSAEWEYAASASFTSPDGGKDKAFVNKILEWYSRPSLKLLPDASSGKSNYWGAYNMHGVIWEWVDDFNNVLVNGESRGDTGLERDLFCGSGSIRNIDPSNYAAFMRYAFRSSLKANYTVGNLGFRCAKDFSTNLTAGR